VGTGYLLSASCVSKLNAQGADVVVLWPHFSCRLLMMV
jgi:hypothetical protein